jgi:hypothetical protein
VPAVDVHGLVGTGSQADGKVAAGQFPVEENPHPFVPVGDEDEERWSVHGRATFLHAETPPAMLGKHYGGKPGHVPACLAAHA